MSFHSTWGHFLVHFSFLGEADSREGKKTIELDPNFYIAHYFLGETYEIAGKYEEAIAEHAAPALKAAYMPLDRSGDVFHWDPL